MPIRVVSVHSQKCTFSPFYFFFQIYFIFFCLYIEVIASVADGIWTLKMCCAVLCSDWSVDVLLLRCSGNPG